MMTAGWVGTALAIAVPAGLTATGSRRFLVPAMLAWTVSPVLVYAALVAWEIETRPPTANPIGTAFYGFMLISPVLAPPWLLACLIGFGVGLRLRRVLRPARPRPPPPAGVPSTEALAAPNSAAPPTPVWHHVHIGVENDGLMIGGLEVWKHQWRRDGRRIVELPHPTHPNQTHGYEIFAIGNESSPVRFAACELSNGVWGFSIDADDLVDARGTSQNGSLRHEHRFGRGEAGPEHPLPDLAAVVDAARLATSPAAGPPRRRLISPDARILVDLVAIEWSNSHWVDSPRVIHVATGRVLLDLWGTDWDAAVSFPRSYCVRLDLRRYRHGGSQALEIDLGRDTCQIVSEYGHEGSYPPAPLAEIGGTLEESSSRASAAAAAASGVNTAATAARRVTPHAWAAWRTALLIAAGAAIAIAGLSFLALNFDSPGRRISAPLSVVPSFK